MCLIGEILTDNMGYGESGWGSLFVESKSLKNSNKKEFLDDKVQIRIHTDVCSFYLFPDSSDYPEKDPVVRYIQDFLGCNVRGMSVSFSKSDEHKSVVIILGVRMRLNKLSNGTSHEV